MVRLACACFVGVLLVPNVVPNSTLCRCGDSMNAGFMVGLARGLEPEAIARGMLLAATANLFTPRPGDLRSEALANYADMVKVVRL